MKVVSGLLLAKSFIARPSDPESGPTRIWTPSCSISLRAARIAVSGLASEEALISSIL